MVWIINLLLSIISSLWALWVCLFRQIDINDVPFAKWFEKCWRAKEKCGKIAWNEFLALMKYLSLLYIQNPDVHKYYEYEKYVKMTPFRNENRDKYTEEDWDTLISNIYGVEDKKGRIISREKRSSGESPTYEWEGKEEKSKIWLWILLAILIVGGAGWYFFIKDSGKEISNDYNKTNPIEQTNSGPVEKQEEEDVPAPTGELAFLEQFYKGDYAEEEFIKQNVTANVLNKLKRDYEYDCSSGDCLATWVFTAYPPGSDLNLEEGPIITESREEGKYSVFYRYYTQGQSGRIYHPRGLLVSVTEVNGKYLISDYELVMPDIKNEMPQDVQEEEEEIDMPSEDVVSQERSAMDSRQEMMEKHESPKNEDMNIYDNVDQMPSFPGGQAALMQWLSSNMKYPTIAAENGIQGRVNVQFVVEKDGSLSNVHVVSPVDPSLDKEALRVVKSLPRMIPGKKNGSPVRVKYTVPVTFKL